MINKANILGSLGITHNNRGANKPATAISWFEKQLSLSTGSTPIAAARPLTSSTAGRLNSGYRVTQATTPTISTATGPADITQAGGLSPYGTAGQGGNVQEWEETDFDLVNNSSSSIRGIRGGLWSTGSSLLLSSFRSVNFVNPANGDFNVGFRVASIPEPSTLLLGAMASVGLLFRRRRLS